MDRQLNKGSRKYVNAVRSDARISPLQKGSSFIDSCRKACAHRTPAVDCSIQFIRHTGSKVIFLPTDVEAGKAC
ncbi:MAG TPA: hypothetical protein PLN56_01280 [Methanoregulaceae archaeon]|nr:hypothetical protein [Methanoregulaceae archaeon]